jgi:MYXO-CTERM domain-containing protein
MLSPALCLVLLGPPVGPTDHDSGAHECVHPDSPGAWTDLPDQPVAAIDCEEHTDVGYVEGDPFDITVVTVDGKPVEVETANAFYQMAQAAAADGVTIKINSGFRTMAEQEYFYGCYVNCNCNNCNLAAKPGFSNHQSGHALDLNTSASGVYNWLANHGGAYGFERTVPSEDWHWEWWGGGPPVSGPCGVADYAAEFVAQSFPYASAPPVVLTVGDVLDATLDLENTGEATWTINTRLAPTPRDQPSPLYDTGWMSPTRIAAPDADTPPGAVGRFSFRFAATVPGDYYQTFGLVEEGVTWFSDAPLGGGPPDDQLEVHIVVVEDPNPPPPPPPEDTTAGDVTGGMDPSAGDDSEAGTGVGDSGEGGDDDSGAPTTGGSPGSDGAPTTLPGASDPGLTTDSGDAGDDGCGCNTRASGGWFGMLALLGLARARKRRVIAP